MSHVRQPAALGISARTRRSQGRLPRNAIARVKVTKDEHKELEAAAKRGGRALSEWGREIMLAAAREPQTDRALFTELTALRLLLTNVLRPVALGEALTPESFQAILKGVRKDKHDAARDLLAQYQPSRTEEQ